MPVCYSVNGADIILDPVQQLGYERIPVWDGPTYLYTIHRMHFRGTYNPATFSWQFGLPAVPVPQPGNLPPTSDIATRHLLMQARGTLVYNIGGVVTAPGLAGIQGGIEVLRSPPGPFPAVSQTNSTGRPVPFLTDAKNGPQPLYCNVIEVKGTKTFLVDWAIETYVNECYLFKSSSSLSALLSQRWTMEEDLDQDFFATRTIRGHAIFRSDRLIALSAVPDDYRDWLFHPVPTNFQRSVQQAIPSEDGTRFDYVLVDREKPFNYTSQVVNLGVTRIEAFYRHGYSKKLGREDAAIRLGGLAFEAAALAGLPAPGDPARGIRQALRLIPQVLDIALDSVPRHNQNIVCRVWGNRTATRANLYQMALATCFSKIGNIALVLGSGSVNVGEDLMGKFIELEVAIQSGPIESAWAAGNVFVGIPNVGPDLITNVTQNDFTQQPQPSLGFARETPYRAMAQFLAGNCGLTPEAINVSPFGTLTP